MKLHKESHLDHGISPAMVEAILATFADEAAFFIASFDLPAGEPSLPCNLHGPAVGEPAVGEDEVRYENRGGREWTSRICDRPPALVRTITVIGGPHDGEPCILYTAYPGPCAPREPGDPALADDAIAKQEATVFWAAHALNM